MLKVFILSLIISLGFLGGWGPTALFAQSRQASLTRIETIEKEFSKIDSSKAGSPDAIKLRKDILEFKGKLQKNLDQDLSATDENINRRTIDDFENRLKALAPKNTDVITNQKTTDVLRQVSELERNIASLNETPKVIELRKQVAGLKEAIEKSDESVDTKAFDGKIQQFNQDYKKLKEEQESGDGLLWFILKWLIPIVAIFLLVGLVVWGFLHLRGNKERERSEIRAAFSDLKSKNNGFNQKLETLTKITTDLSQQIAQQKAEIGRLKQSMTSSSGSSFAPPPPPVAVVPKEQPRFPVSADEYLGKVGSGSVSVKYDYKEGMLVTDPTNEGGLLVVQDEGRSYLIPSFGFFQTKSDYTNYFERFYSCQRPMGGNVWILRPSTVNQVAGGWQLDAMGELEVR